MLSMTNKLYNQVKARLSRVDKASEHDIEQGAQPATDAPRPFDSEPIDKQDATPLMRVVVYPRNLPRPSCPRA